MATATWQWRTDRSYLSGVNNRKIIVAQVGPKFDRPTFGRRVLYILGAARFGTTSPYAVVPIDASAYADALASANRGDPWSEVVRRYGHPVYRGLPHDHATTTYGGYVKDVSWEEAPSYPASAASADLERLANEAEAILRSAAEPPQVHAMRNAAALAGINWTLPQARKIFALDHGMGETRAEALSSGGVIMDPIRSRVTNLPASVRYALQPLSSLKPRTTFVQNTSVPTSGPSGTVFTTREGTVPPGVGAPGTTQVVGTVAIGGGIGAVVGGAIGGIATKSATGAAIGALVAGLVGGGIGYAVGSTP